MTNHRLKLITTQDGSHSLLREDLNETYHSFHGAMSESLYVFIEQCLRYAAKTTGKSVLKVFEVGFGTGLNAFLSAQYASSEQIKVDFHTVEPFPVPEEIYSQLNYGKPGAEKGMFQKIHEATWGAPMKVTDEFTLAKYESTLEDFDQASGFDCIFFDAFAPSRQAEVWSLENLTKCFALCAPGGVLTTYCAQGAFKRNLKEAGFEVETLKGAMGKKEMVRGVRPQ